MYFSVVFIGTVDLRLPDDRENCSIQVYQTLALERHLQFLMDLDSREWNVDHPWVSLSENTAKIQILKTHRSRSASKADLPCRNTGAEVGNYTEFPDKFV